VWGVGVVGGGGVGLGGGWRGGGGGVGGGGGGGGGGGICLPFRVSFRNFHKGGKIGYQNI